MSIVLCSYIDVDPGHEEHRREYADHDLSSIISEPISESAKKAYDQGHEAPQDPEECGEREHLGPKPALRVFASFSIESHHLEYDTESNNMAEESKQLEHRISCLFT